jgi:hypothetical protein
MESETTATKSKESFRDQLSRVESMAYDESGTWDLSENDTAALEAVLRDRQRLAQRLNDQPRLLREFVGFLSADVPELHSVEIPRLAESLESFLVARQQAQATNGSGDEAHAVAPLQLLNDHCKEKESTGLGHSTSGWRDKGPKALNAAGILTSASCCGHGKGQGRIDLTDGRVLFIEPPSPATSGSGGEASSSSNKLVPNDQREKGKDNASIAPPVSERRPDMRFDMLDFPTAWEIQKRGGLEHHPRCSSVPGWSPISGPGLLCDCGAVNAEWERLRVTR